MRVVIVTAGTRGDTQPYIALGQGFQRAGHAVRIVAPVNFASLIAEHGVEVCSVNVDTQAMMRGDFGQGFASTGSNFLLAIAQMIRAFGPLMNTMAREYLAACEGAEVIVGNLLGSLIAWPIAEKLNAPYVDTNVIPMLATAEYPSVFWPWPGNRGSKGGVRGAFNRLTHTLFIEAGARGMRPMLNRVQTRVLGIRPYPLFGDGGRLDRQGFLTLLGFSPTVCPPPADWGDHVHVTGYWFVDDQQSKRKPPDGLRRFLDGGPPPVYAGFGSMPGVDPAALTDTLVEALRLSGQRGVLLSGWADVGKKDVPESIYVTGGVSHEWLFPRCSAVIHHGGAGTTAASLRAGVPTIPIPFMGDQPFWARRVHEFGVGPAPIPRPRLTARRLAEAIQQAVSDREMRERAATLGRQIAAEDGVGRAVEVFDQAMR